VPTDKILGVQTGRTWEEALFGMEVIGLNSCVPETSLVTKRDGFHKPNPGGFALLQTRLGFGTALYIGDTLDDLRTVQAFNEGRQSAIFLSAQVLSGPAGAANEKPFRTAGADLVAPDVNAVLDWLAS
jgi:phosphoglycolate phosphatase-like HAD superfamily hydrolase